MSISFSPSADREIRARGAGVTAVLGPTNTGKTHLAIERMLAHSSGIIGLPLRLLAREVYNRAVERVGAEAVALVTGEEKIKPPNPRFWVATVVARKRSCSAPPPCGRSSNGYCRAPALSAGRDCRGLLSPAKKSLRDCPGVPRSSRFRPKRFTRSQN